MRRLHHAMAALAVSVAGLALALVTGCGGPRGVTPKLVSSEVQQASTDARFARGEVVFMAHCNSCHPNAGAGLGPRLYELPVTSGMIAFQVRHGLGPMPAFDERTISDADLAALLRYLDVLEELPTET